MIAYLAEINEFIKSKLKYSISNYQLLLMKCPNDIDNFFPESSMRINKIEDLLNTEKSELETELNKYINKSKNKSTDKSMLENKIKQIKKKINKSLNEIIDLAKQASESYTKLIQQAIDQCNEDKVKNEIQKVLKYQISILQNIENTDEERIKELTKHFDHMFAIFVNSCKEKTHKTIRSSHKKI